MTNLFEIKIKKNLTDTQAETVISVEMKEEILDKIYLLLFLLAKKIKQEVK